MGRYLLGAVAGHRLADRTFENFVWAEENEVAREILYSFLEKDVWDRGVGLVGDVGVGKSHLLIALYKNRLWVSVYRGAPVPVWLSFVEFVSEARKRREFVEELVSEFGIVFLDDVWSAGMGWDEKDLFRELVMLLYDRGKVLCYTSNFPIERWDLDERVKDRLREMCIEVEIKGFSFRKLLGAVR